MAPLDTRSKVRATAVAVAALGLVVVVGLLIVASPSWSASEVRVVAAVHDASNGVFDIIALAVNSGFGPVGAALIVLILVAWVAVLRRSWRDATLLLLVLVVPWSLAETIKIIVQRPRPDPSAMTTALIVPDPSSFSYPSGHTAFATALVSAVVLVLVTRRRRNVLVASVIGGAVILITAWSRVYLGVHYPTDVTASIVVVIAVAIAVHRWTADLRMFAEGASRDGARQS